MKVTIVVDDGVMGVDGVFYKIDLTGLPKTIRAIQFDSEKGGGHIEMVDGSNAPLKSVAGYKGLLDSWYAARTEAKKPKEPVPVDIPDPVEKPEKPDTPKEPSKADIIAEQIRKSSSPLDSIPKLYSRLMLIEKYLGIRD